ncbi:MAG TPA: class II fructose-bisphosphate aldolase [Candidatus Moranbacteria bacterium]|nr:class II fructose-bisphosphate aldolase [Candidatus Moranbacteria bacterium]
MITPVIDILKKAQEEGYAVGAFNTTNLETTRAIIDAAKEMQSPVIVQITEKTMEYAGGRAIFNLVKNCAEFYAPEIPIGIHLDHGKSLEIIERCAEIGLPSVMYDGSRHIYEDNVVITRKVVEFCHAKGISVQGELGSVPYIGETNMMGEIDWDKYMTDPDQAEDFVCKTGIDSLAVAIGNAHGFFKERTEPDYARLEAIRKKISIPLVLHGASDWENGRVKEVIARGISCFNVDTAIRLAFVNDLIKSVREQNDVYFDIRKLLGDAREAVKKTVKDKMHYFGSEGKVKIEKTECVFNPIKKKEKKEDKTAE